MEYASIAEDVQIAKTGLLFLMGAVYTVYHFVLWKRGYGVAKAVWCVAAMYGASLAANVITVVLTMMEKESVIVEDGGRATTHQIALLLGLWFLSILANLAWCMALLLVGYGFDIVVPSLSQSSVMWIKRTLYFASAIPGIFVLSIIVLALVPLPFVWLLVVIPGVLVALAFVAFYLWRFLLAVHETQGEIRVQSNLIPELRRMQFETRYRRLKILSIAVIVTTTLMILISILTNMYMANAGVAVGLYVNIFSTLITIGFFVGLTILFHVTPSESLKLYGAPQPHEIGGFDSIQQQDDEIFA